MQEILQINAFLPTLGVPELASVDLIYITLQLRMEPWSERVFLHNLFLSWLKAYPSGLAEGRKYLKIDQSEATGQPANQDLHGNQAIGPRVHKEYELLTEAHAGVLNFSLCTVCPPPPLTSADHPLPPAVSSPPDTQEERIWSSFG
jgi:hypothetical protein